MKQNRAAAAICATAIAISAWAGIASEAMTSFGFSKMAGRAPLTALLFFYRYFTNQAITILASIMTLTALRLFRERDMFGARFYAAILAYVTVMGTVYEALLRRLWSPTGFWLYRDALMHDILPTATLMFWIFFAPKRPLAWTDAIVWLWYPAAYLLVTLALGLSTGTYPYPFLNPGAAGWLSLLLHILGLASAFYISGLAVIALSRLAR